MEKARIIIGVAVDLLSLPSLLLDLGPFCWWLALCPPVSTIGTP